MYTTFQFYGHFNITLSITIQTFLIAEHSWSNGRLIHEAWERVKERNVFWLHTGGMGKGKSAVIRTSESGLFHKCPSVDTHSGVTLQQTYYLLFCHFGFSTTNLGPDSISTADRCGSPSASALPLRSAERMCEAGGLCLRRGGFYTTSRLQP